MNDIVLKNEELFHDEWASGVDVNEIDVVSIFEACTMPENRKIMEWLKDVRDKEILELGCGLGEASTYLALCGANVTATDLSSGMLEVANKLALKNGTSIKTIKCDADSLPFPDNQFDIVYCSNLLHHVDIEITVKEIYRVLKNGGVFVAWEPLAHNPAINIYRRMATEVRTEDEHPLRTKDIRVIKNIFGNLRYDCTWLITLLIFVKYYFIDKYNPNKIRYWKQILVEHKKLEPMYNKLEKIDNFILRYFPFLGKYCWNIILMAKKN